MMNVDFDGRNVDIPVTSEGIRQMRADCRAIVLTALEAIVARSERDPHYSFIDTKLDLATGRDFPSLDPLLGRRTTYGWIQGRGLEALAGHAAWLGGNAELPERERRALQSRIHAVLYNVVERLEDMRLANRGHLFFLMSAKRGTPLEIADSGDLVPLSLPAQIPSNFSDLFYAKGLAAAAAVFQDAGLSAQAGALFNVVMEDVLAGRFQSDQLPMDPRNPVAPVPGRLSHGGWMIAIGGCSTFLQHTGDAAHFDGGLRLIDHVLSNYVNVEGRGGPARRYDMWEFVRPDCTPWLEGACLRSDPGHATEFVGLSLKLLRVAEAAGLRLDAMGERCGVLRRLLPLVLKQNVANGFSPQGLGIVKAVDLVSREPMNPEMPWWPLPETMRAACETARLLPPPERQPWLDVAGRCFNAFVSHFVRREVHLMAYQTLGPDGRPSASIPGTPDADPGYHTGLSLIDCLDAFDLMLDGPADRER